MNQLGGFPLLTLIVATPLFGAVMILLLRPARADTLRWLALLVAFAEFSIALFLYMGWAPDTSGGPQFQDGPWSWIPSLGMRHHLAIDGVNVHLVGLTTMVVPLVLIAVWRQAASAERVTLFWVLTLEASTLGALTTRDLACFTLFWLVALVSAFLLAGVNRYSSQAAMLYVVAMAAIAVLMLTCLVFLLSSGVRVDIADQSANPLPWRAQAWLFWAMAIALGIGSALFPFHYWYIAAQRHASWPARSMTSVVLLNIGCSGLMRFCLPAFPLAVTRFAPVLILLSTLGLAYGAVKALHQPKIQDVLAYWNTAQMNLALMGVFSLQNLGMHGAALLTLARALCAAALLLMDPTQDEPQPTPPQEVGLGLREGRIAPLLGLLSALAIAGPLGLIAQGTLVLGLTRWHWQPNSQAVLAVMWDWLWYAAVGLGLLLSASASLRLCVSAISTLRQTAARRYAVLAIPLLLVALLVGVRPSVFSDMIGPTVYRLLFQITSASEASQEQNTLPSYTPDQVPTPPARQPDAASVLPTHELVSVAESDSGISGLWQEMAARACTWAGSHVRELSLA